MNLLHENQKLIEWIAFIVKCFKFLLLGAMQDISYNNDVDNEAFEMFKYNFDISTSNSVLYLVWQLFGVQQIVR